MFRSLRSHAGQIDLCSNDYLGASRRICAPTASRGVDAVGATGSRLVSGTHNEHLAFEQFLATFHQTESALLFGSGYEANLGLLSATGSRHDTIIYDDRIHASMRDGIRLSMARSFSFHHNDLDDLRSKIPLVRGDCFIAVESLYSMDGDQAPLAELCALAEETGAYLLVDEAHATGVYGEKGEGLVQHLGLQDRVFARIHTFGKALGFKGACVVGPAILRDTLVNFSRPFIYSTAPDLLSVSLMREAYQVTQQLEGERLALFALIEQFRAMRAQFPELRFLESESPIQGVLVPGNEAVLHVEAALREAGFAARAIRSPTVAQGEERIRICLHSFNTRDELHAALSVAAEASAPRRVCGI
jgi:8-amino-7-oxononanoate synthase